MDNFHNSCPPKMNDNRFLTDYRSAKIREPTVKKLISIDDEHDFRMFLQTNSENIISETWNTLKSNTCSPTSCLHDCGSLTTDEKMSKKIKQYSANSQPTCDKLNDMKINE